MSILGSTSLTQKKMFRISSLGNAWAGFHNLMSGKAATTSSASAASSQPMKLICDKWRPAGLGLLLTDRDQWAALGCQSRG